MFQKLSETFIRKFQDKVYLHKNNWSSKLQCSLATSQFTYHGFSTSRVLKIFNQKFHIAALGALRDLLKNVQQKFKIEQVYVCISPTTPAERLWLAGQHHAI